MEMWEEALLSMSGMHGRDSVCGCMPCELLWQTEKYFFMKLEVAEMKRRIDKKKEKMTGSSPCVACLHAFAFLPALHHMHLQHLQCICILACIAPHASAYVSALQHLHQHSCQHCNTCTCSLAITAAHTSAFLSSL